MDIYFELQIFIDKFKQNRLGARDANLVWATVDMERMAFFVLHPQKPRVPGGMGMFPSTARIYLDGRELIILLVAT